MSSKSEFKSAVIESVRQIPTGKVATYGQIAAMAGSPRAARVVGQIAHFGEASEPWHRVVTVNGRLAPNYPGGIERQQAELEADAIAVTNGYVDMDEFQWQT